MHGMYVELRTCRMRLLQESATRANVPSGANDSPLGLLNVTPVVPMPSLDPSLPVPASVVVTPVLTTTLRIRSL